MSTMFLNGGHHNVVVVAERHSWTRTHNARADAISLPTSQWREVADRPAYRQDEVDQSSCQKL